VDDHETVATHIEVYCHHHHEQTGEEVLMRMMTEVGSAPGDPPPAVPWSRVYQSPFRAEILTS
jgi:hypothetical protein